MIETGSLATKYRPKDISEFVGNKGLKTTIRGFLTQNRMPNALLLQGGTGLGKTTVARILAKYLVCQEGTICGKCSSCLLGVSANTDIKEVDIGDERGIDVIRNLKSESKVRPMFSPNRVFILDEIHAATGQAASALLKVLEEPEEKSSFILCTTDPQKVLKTIRGRCTELIVKKPTVNDYAKNLISIARKEGVRLGKDYHPALKEIYRITDGHVRNGIQLLEHVIATINSGEDFDINILVEDFRVSLETDADRAAVSVIAAVLKGDVDTVIEVTASFRDQNALLFKSKFLVDSAVNVHAKAIPYTPTSVTDLNELLAGAPKIGNLIRLGNKIAEVENALSSGLSDITLRYAFLIVAHQIASARK